MTTTPRPYSAWNVEEYEYPRHGTLDEKLKFLLNYAILAPSLHNTQPWQFAVRSNEIHVLADRTRQLLVADADARELYISVGCALENLLTAATFFGLSTTVTYFPEAKNEVWVASVSFKENGNTASLAEQEHFHAIPLRHTNRQRYAHKSVNDRDVQSLYATLQEPDITLELTEAPEIKKEIDELVITADITQFADPEYRDELNNWISQGEFGYRWLISRVGQLATTYLESHHKPTKTDADIVLNAPLLALISTTSDDRLAQIKAGQAFERIALKATALNLGIQPLSQILQVSELKPAVTKLFGGSAPVPQIAFRIGYTDVAQDATARKQVDAVTTT
jgi:hypothetical protein